MKKMVFGMWLAATAAGVSATAGVTCRVEPDYAVREADKPGEAYVKVSLAADKVAAKNRPSVNLAIVLDRSSSMQGDRIVKAREAACEAINRLEARDVVSVVVYDNTAETIIPAQHVTEKPALMAKIRAIEPRGCTALFAGVAKGAEELKKFRGACEISRVLLLSDGQANVGPSSAEELGRYGALLMKDGVAVSTIGLGAYYNEDLMTRLAQKSDGNSYFVENSGDLPRIFASELGDVLSVAATRVQLTVRFAGTFTPVAIVGRDGRIVDNTVTIDLNQLYGGQTKYVLVKCDVAPGKEGTTTLVGTACVAYLDPVDGKECRLSGTGSVAYSSDIAAVKASINKDVIRERVLNENALRMEEALRFADRGDFERASALTRRNIAVAEEAQVLIGADANLAAEAAAQESWSTKLKSRTFAPNIRKEMKTDSFRKMNQQSTGK